MAEKPQRSQKIPLKYKEYEMDPHEVEMPERNLPHPGPSPDFPPNGKYKSLYVFSTKMFKGHSI